MDAALLDTDILSEVLKQRNAAVAQKAADYLQDHGQFAFSAFTRFEIERGYKEKGATRQLARFATFCRHSLVLPVTNSIFDRAGDLWALARQGGHPHGDADLIIAANCSGARPRARHGQHGPFRVDSRAEDRRLAAAVKGAPSEPHGITT